MHTRAMGRGRDEARGARTVAGERPAARARLTLITLQKLPPDGMADAGARGEGALAEEADDQQSMVDG